MIHDGFFAPQVLELVIIAFGFSQQMNDDRTKVKDHPTRTRHPLPTKIFYPMLAELCVNLFLDRPQLRLRLAAADHDRIDDLRNFRDIQDLDIGRLLALGRLGDYL
jgi:hypothetical protein